MVGIPCCVISSSISFWLRRGSVCRLLAPWSVVVSSLLPRLRAAGVLVALIPLS